MSFELTILGSSSALPTSDKYPTAQVLNVLGRFFLIDCGEGTQIQIRRNRIGFSKIKHVFISHLHGDHYFGLIGLISTLNLLGLKTNLHIYAHSELRELLKPQLEFSKSEKSVNLVFHPLNMKKPDVIFSDKKVEVISFPVKHSLPTCGFLFREKQAQPNMIKEAILKYDIPIKKIREIKAGADFVTEKGIVIPHQKLTTPPPKPRSYAFCTDTAYHKPITEIIKGVDLLYHEATFPEEMKDFAAQTYHSTPKDAATIARDAQVKKLLIGHFSTRYNDDQLFENEARTIFPNTEAVVEGRTYSI